MLRNRGDGCAGEIRAAGSWYRGREEAAVHTGIMNSVYVLKLNLHILAHVFKFVDYFYGLPCRPFL